MVRNMTPGPKAADLAQMATLSHRTRPWASLNRLQLGRFAEYFVTIALVRSGLDVYTPAIDDRGIDLVARIRSGQYLEIQVKATRGLNYVYLRKSVFPIDGTRYLAYVRFAADYDEPCIYLIPATAWLTPNRLFVSRDYEGKKSAPEYGLNLTSTTLADLEAFQLQRVLAGLIPAQSSST
jgi:hypothetical protein